jgi:hypothetical protein
MEVERDGESTVMKMRRDGGSPVARIVPDEEKVCAGADLNKAVVGARLASEEAGACSRDLRSARSRLKPVTDKWR